MPMSLKYVNSVILQYRKYAKMAKYYNISKGTPFGILLILYYVFEIRWLCKYYKRKYKFYFLTEMEDKWKINIVLRRKCKKYA